MAATSGIMLLVSGPVPPPTPHAQLPHSQHPAQSQQQHHSPVPATSSVAAQHYLANGNSSSPAQQQLLAVQDRGSRGVNVGAPAALSAGVQAELAGSWEDLAMLLSGMASGVQVSACVYLCVLVGGISVELGLQGVNCLCMCSLVESEQVCCMAVLRDALWSTYTNDHRQGHTQASTPRAFTSPPPSPPSTHTHTRQSCIGTPCGPCPHGC